MRAGATENFAELHTLWYPADYSLQPGWPIARNDIESTVSSIPFHVEESKALLAIDSSVPEHATNEHVELTKPIYQLSIRRSVERTFQHRFGCSLCRAGSGLPNP